MNKNDFSSHRRDWMAGAAVGVAAVGLASNSSRTEAAPIAGNQPDPPPLRNASELYVKPPFEAQSQEWPGLAGKMNPRPDHGETSYVGRGRLKGRKALITGGDS